MRRFSVAFQAMDYFFSWIYPLLYSLFALSYLPFYLYRVFVRRGGRIPLLQRAGKLPSQITSAKASGLRRLWVHAVSVGEVNVVKPLLKELEGSVEVCLSTTTETGQALAQSLFPSVPRFYFPLDWQWVCRRYLRAVAPAAVAVAETELWPGFIRSAASLGVPLILVNGRLSDSSFRRYRRVRFFLRPLLRSFAAVCVQSRQDKTRFLELGASPGRLHLTGNLKYDYQLSSDPAKELLTERLEGLMKPTREALLWVCGSTREGEETLLLDVFSELAADFPELRILLAPRHPHRAAEVESQLQRRGIPHRVRSRVDWETPPPDGSARALILDSIGELAYIYRAADIVFMGGSLFPTGGHNLIEAANFGKPILFGPHMENFREIADAFLNSYAALQVASSEELPSKLRDLLRDPKARAWLGRNARKVVRENQGAVGRTATIVRECLNP